MVTAYVKVVFLDPPVGTTQDDVSHRINER